MRVTLQLIIGCLSVEGKKTHQLTIACSILLSMATTLAPDALLRDKVKVNRDTHLTSTPRFKVLFCTQQTTKSDSCSDMT